MARTSETSAFEEIYNLILALPLLDHTAIFQRFQELKDTTDWYDRFNHELLWHCYNKHLGRGVFDQAADEYQETLRAMELWEELL